MKTGKGLNLVLQAILLGISLLIPTGVGAQTTEFVYNGSLGSNTSQDHDMEFRLFDAATGGTQVGGTIVVTEVAVTKGKFRVILDFGPGAFADPDRFLEAVVRPAGSLDPYTPLGPREKIYSVPSAVSSVGALSADSLSQACQACVTDSHIGSVSGSKVTGTVANAANAVTAENITGVVPIANGGTGSATQNFVDLSTNQTVGGNKAFTGMFTATGNLVRFGGNANFTLNRPTNSTGAGADFLIQGQAAGIPHVSGGNLRLMAGDAGGTGLGGDLHLNAGRGLGSGDDGRVLIGTTAREVQIGFTNTDTFLRGTRVTVGDFSNNTYIRGVNVHFDGTNVIFGPTTDVEFRGPILRVENSTTTGALTVQNATTTSSLTVQNATTTGSLTVQNTITGSAAKAATFSASSPAAPSVRNLTVLRLNLSGPIGGFHEITDLIDGVDGQCITLIHNGAAGSPVRIVDSGNFQLSGDWVGDRDDTLTVCRSGSKWYETTRSNNL